MKAKLNLWGAKIYFSGKFWYNGIDISRTQEATKEYCIKEAQMEGEEINKIYNRNFSYAKDVGSLKQWS